MNDISKRNIAIYIRVEPYGPSENEQKNVVLQHLNSCKKAQDFSLYIDQQSDRKAYASLIEDLSSRKFSELICWKFDRFDLFADSLEDTFEFFERLEKSETCFTSVADNFNSKESTKLFTEIHNMSSQAKATLRAERVKTSLADASKSGKHIGRPLTVDRDAVANLRSQGYSIRNIAASMGISTSTVQAALK